MTPERWAQIEDLFHRAVECGPERRTALLDQSCSDDPELRREVEALLSCDGSARDNVQAAVRPAIEEFGFSLTGQVISHYRILDGLGGGGMGLVYRAEDIRLRRQVALKFLPEESANNPVALARFEREARAVSAVEHPNICPIYEFGEHEGRPFLVMQLLEGQTLRELLEVRRSEESKPGVGAAAQRNMALPLDRVLDLGIQIADGLHAAHRKGIIHRDIKPANIFVTNEGQVKILDFGLAKLAEDVAISDDDMAANTEGVGEGARNVDPVLSRTGAAIGTVAYMSPEQASGETLDRRSDIYSFGLVLYEMATGALPRSGANTSCSDVRLVRSEPVTAGASVNTTWTSYQVIKGALVRGRKRQLQSYVPRQLETVISRATDRDRERRYQNISELAKDLRRTKLERVSRKQRTRMLLILLALSLLLAAAAPKIFRFTQQFYRLRQLQNLTLVPLTTTLSGNAVAPAFSPDGRKIVFAWDGENGDQAYDLYVKPIGTEELHRLTKQPGMYHSAWSPDGRSIAFVRRSDPGHSGLFIIPSSGGPERKITSSCYSTPTGIGTIAWSPNGKQIACIEIGQTPTTAQLLLVATDSLAVTPVETACSRPISPSFSPDSEYLSWTCVPIIGGASEVQFMRLGTRRVSRLLQRADTIGGPVWDPNGQRLVFSSNMIGDIWEVSFRDPDRLEKVLAGHDAFDLAFSPSGDRLAFAQNHTNVNIWAVDVTGAQPDAFLKVSSSREQNAPAVSPDGSKIAFESNRSGDNEIWVSDEYGRNSVQLSSFGIRMTGTPRWSPDGNLIAFDSRADGESNIYLVDPRGGRPRKLVIDIRGNSQPSWSRDSNWIYFVNGEDAQHPTCWKVSAAGGHAIRLTDGPASRPFESPDGRNLYFVRQSGQLVRADTDGHELEEVRDIGPVPVGGWVPVDDGIYFIHFDNNGRNIAFFDFATRSIRPIYKLRKPSPRWFGGMSVYRNWLLFPQLDNQTSDLVMIENWNRDAATQKNEVGTDTLTPLQSAQSPTGGSTAKKVPAEKVPAKGGPTQAPPSAQAQFTRRSPNGYVPNGWALGGTNRAGYETGVDPQTAINGHPSVYLKSKFAPGLRESSVTPSPEDFGTLWQGLNTKNYTGKRLRFRAFVKSENVKGWAGLWMSVAKGSQTVAFDNMHDRWIEGTTGWKSYQIVLDAPPDATDIYFGILLDGPGSVWLNSVNLEVVGSEVTTTDQKDHQLPR